MTMRFVFVSITLLFTLLLVGCGFVHDEHIVGEYRLIAVDIDAQMSICYDLGDGVAVGRIAKTVFSYGFDDRFIVGKQHPNNNRNITNYFFLERDKDSMYADPSESVTGPLTQKEFDEASERLNLPKFTRILKFLE